MDNIKQKTKIGIFWNAFEKVFVQGVSFVLNIILARLLSPHDYGTIGMLTVFLTFSNVFVDSGFSRALIQRQDRTERDFSTVLIFNVAVSCDTPLVSVRCITYNHELYIASHRHWTDSSCRKRIFRSRSSCMMMQAPTERPI